MRIESVIADASGDRANRAGDNAAAQTDNAARNAILANVFRDRPDTWAFAGIQ